MSKEKIALFKRAIMIKINEITMKVFLPDYFFQKF